MRWASVSFSRSRTFSVMSVRLEHANTSPSISMPTP
jgi:hypothetical protein